MSSKTMRELSKRSFHKAQAHLDRDSPLVACPRAFSELTRGEQLRGAVASEDVAPDLDQIALRTEKKFISQCLGNPYSNKMRRKRR